MATIGCEWVHPAPRPECLSSDGYAVLQASQAPHIGVFVQLVGSRFYRSSRVGLPGASAGVGTSLSTESVGMLWLHAECEGVAVAPRHRSAIVLRRARPSRSCLVHRLAGTGGRLARSGRTVVRTGVLATPMESGRRAGCCAQPRSVNRTRHPIKRQALAAASHSTKREEYAMPADQDPRCDAAYKE